jgi:hypothetical protein
MSAQQADFDIKCYDSKHPLAIAIAAGNTQGIAVVLQTLKMQQINLRDLEIDALGDAPLADALWRKNQAITATKTQKIIATLIAHGASLYDNGGSDHPIPLWSTEREYTHVLVAKGANYWDDKKGCEVFLDSPTPRAWAQECCANPHYDPRIHLNRLKMARTSFALFIKLDPTDKAALLLNMIFTDPALIKTAVGKPQTIRIIQTREFKRLYSICFKPATKSMPTEKTKIIARTLFQTLNTKPKKAKGIFNRRNHPKPHKPDVTQQITALKLTH